MDGLLQNPKKLFCKTKLFLKTVAARSISNSLKKNQFRLHAIDQQKSKVQTIKQ